MGNRLKRIIMDFEPEDMDKIDNLKKKMHCVSRTELIRRALGMLAAVEKYSGAGYDIRFTKGEEVKHVEFVGWQL